MLFLDTPEAKPTPEETFIWVVTKKDVRWVRSDVGKEALAREVQGLRCGLDPAAWGAERSIPIANAQNQGNKLSFDLFRSYALYKALFSEIEDLIRGKNLIIVPSGPLTQLPFQVLVSRQPANGDYQSAAWLICNHALTVLPAVSSLKALRRVARPSAAKKPMIGFGNPLLEGNQNSPYALGQRLLAQKWQHCSQIKHADIRATLSSPRGISPVPLRALADVNDLKKYGASP